MTAEQPAPLASAERTYPKLTITVEDPDTGLTTTITGRAEVDVTTTTEDPHDPFAPPYEFVPRIARLEHSLRLAAKWHEERNGQAYTITRLPTRDEPATDMHARLELGETWARKVLEVWGDIAKHDGEEIPLELSAVLAGMETALGLADVPADKDGLEENGPTGDHGTETSA